MLKRDIDKCSICSKEHVLGLSERISSGLAIIHSRTEDFCVECWKLNTYVNFNRVVFLKFDGKLFIYEPFCFYQVFSDEQIERAFNPDYFNFQKWVNE